MDFTNFVFVIAFIINIIFVNVSYSVKKANVKTMSATVRIENMVAIINLLKIQKGYEKQLEKLAEDLKFSDTSVSVEVDMEIEDKIMKLEMAFAKENGEKKQEISRLIEEIALLTKKRKILA